MLKLEKLFKECFNGISIVFVGEFFTKVFIKNFINFLLVFCFINKNNYLERKWQFWVGIFPSNFETGFENKMFI